MAARAVVVVDVLPEHVPQMSLAERDDVVEALAADAADRALDERGLHAGALRHRRGGDRVEESRGERRT